jgi:molybdopterin molybdotransferase
MSDPTALRPHTARAGGTVTADPSGAAGRHGMVSVADARERMLGATAPVSGVEVVPLARALGRVVATPLVSPCAVPPADNSAMDGFALRYADLAHAGGSLPIAGRTAAGETPGTLLQGTAMRILTGAVVPAGADTVVPLEACQVQGDTLSVRPDDVTRGSHIRPAGEDVGLGSVALPSGRTMRPQDVGVAASIGAAHLEVRRALRAAIVTTGDELTTPGEPLSPGRLYDSNGPMLRALLTTLGCVVTRVARVGDDLAATREALRAASADADLVLTSGGVSVGDEDHVKAAVRALGTIELWKVAIQPGKPIGFGHVAGVPWLGLPGNPLSGLVTFLVLGAPLIRRLQGRERLVPPSLSVPAGFSRARVNTREEYVRVSLEGGRLVPYANQGSGVLRSAAQGDGLACIPAGTLVRDGDLLPFTGYAELLG